MLCWQKKNKHGSMFKIKYFIIFVFLFNVFAAGANAYETALITYPDYNKNWKQIYRAKQYDEVFSQWIPSYEDEKKWTESVVFHSYKWAKGNSSYRFLSNLLANVMNRNPSMRSRILKDRAEDSVAIWCAEKNQNMEAQCEILRVTSSYEGLVAIHYINKNPKAFNEYQMENWLPIIRNVRIYYSYFRWDRVNGKETSIQLQ